MRAPIRGLIKGLDGYLCRRTGVFTFSADPECLLRLQVSPAPHILVLSGSRIQAGEPVLLLHLWNEHMPLLPPTGPSLAWATRFSRLLVRSFRAVAGQIRLDSRLSGVHAVGGCLALLPAQENSGGVHLMQRLGFTVLPYHSPLRRFGEFWENFYAWWLLWAYNPASLRGRRLFRLHRSEIWMSAAEFLRRYDCLSPLKKT